MNIKEIITTYNIKAKKKYGQNFLINEGILKKIVNESSIKGKNVIEIGPGLGSLTIYLQDEAKKLVCYEIDNELVNILKEEIVNDSVTILNTDFLKANLEADIANNFDNDEIIVVANLPYYITTAILTKILEQTKRITKIVVMMQKEVAERITGKPSTKDYNSLSVLIQYYMKTRILFNVSPSSFIPKPNVDSSVVLLERKDKTLPLKSEEFFLKFNRQIFIQRRKTLYNNIKQAFTFTKEQIEQVFAKNNIGINQRAESLEVEQIVNLANDFHELME